MLERVEERVRRVVVEFLLDKLLFRGMLDSCATFGVVGLVVTG